MDLFDKCYQLEPSTMAHRARAALEMGVYPYFIPLTQSEGSEAYVGDHRIIMCGANNYLGLTTHPKVRQAAIDAIREYGTSCTGSRFANGTLEIHLGQDVFAGTYGPIVESLSVLLVFWLICWWLYRQKVFLRI